MGDDAKDEVGWLIEQPGDAHGPRYWTGSGWSTDSFVAVRFAREVDAERARAGLGLIGGVLGHMWCGAAA